MSWRVFIPSKGRAESISTHQVLAGSDYYVVLHNESERQAYAARGDIPTERLVVSDQPTGIKGKPLQQQWIMDHLIEPDEWFIFADDNITRLSAVKESLYDIDRLPVQSWDSVTGRGVFDSPVDWARLTRIADQMRAKAERVRAQLCGFALMDNYYFRGRKYREVGYVIGKLMLLQQSTISFLPNLTMDDFMYTAEHLLHNGAVLINNFLFPHCTHYTAGGIGPFEKRVPYRVEEVPYLMGRYPGLFRPRQRPHFPPDCDLAFRLTTRKQVQRWRREMGVPV